MIKTISFDLDGTLMKKKFADNVWLEGIPRLYSMEKNISFEKSKKFILEKYEEIGDERPEWYDLKYWFEFLDLKTKWMDLLEQYKTTIEPYPEVQGVLERLKEKKYDLIIVSNAKREFIEIELSESRLKKFFTYVFSSTSDYNKVKKFSDFYLNICEEINVKPSEMIHVGDNKKFDFYTPRKIGVTAYYLDREKKENGAFIIYNLEEFEDKIEKLGC